MGLTIHYSLKSAETSVKKVVETVNKIRQLALDLPFEEVGEVARLRGKECDVEGRREELQKEGKDEGLFWMLIQAGRSVRFPWNHRMSQSVNANHMVAFNIWPGSGCEPVNIGFCRYPLEIEAPYAPQDDRRFLKKVVEERRGYRSETWEFNWRRWDRFCMGRFGHRAGPSIAEEKRKIQTGLGGWSWSSFSKTQYASDPRAGGIPNFLRCHISIITLLERAAKLPGVRVRIDDEGKYGPSVYSDDWREASANNRKPTYRRHKGKYSPKALAEEVGDWNTMIAGLAGALGDVLGKNGMALEAPIKEFPNFEQLEFRGQGKKRLQPFLEAVAAMAEKGSTEEASA